MSEWQRLTLGEIAELKSGAGFPKALQGRLKGEIPLAKVGDISRAVRSGAGRLMPPLNHITKAEATTLRAHIFPPGSIVFAKIGEAISQNYRLFTDREACFDNNVMGVIPDRTLVDPRYLFRHLQSIDFYALASKTTVPALRKSELSSVQIPIPPLKEQRRIADILDKADAIRRKRKEAIALTEDLLRSAFLEMFGDHLSAIESGPLNNGWRRMSVDDIKSPGKYTCVGGPFGSKLTSRDYSEEGVPVIRGANLGAKSNSFIDQGFVFVTEQKATELSQNLAYPGDLVFTQRGTLGQVAMLPENCKHTRYVVSQSQMKLTPNPELVERVYLYQYFCTEQIQNYIKSHALTTGVPHINLGILKKIPVLVPPMEQQKAFVIFQTKIQAIRKEAEKGHIHSIELFNALVRDSFS